VQGEVLERVALPSDLDAHAFAYIHPQHVAGVSDAKSARPVVEFHRVQFNRNAVAQVDRRLANAFGA